MERNQEKVENIDGGPSRQMEYMERTQQAHIEHEGTHREHVEHGESPADTPRTS